MGGVVTSPGRRIRRGNAGGRVVRGGSGDPTGGKCLTTVGLGAGGICDRGVTRRRGTEVVGWPRASRNFRIRSSSPSMAGRDRGGAVRGGGGSAGSSSTVPPLAFFKTTRSK